MSNKVVMPKWVHKEIVNVKKRYHKKSNILSHVLENLRMSTEPEQWNWLDDNIVNVAKAIKDGYEVETEYVEIGKLDAISVLTSGKEVKILFPSRAEYIYKFNGDGIEFRDEFSNEWIVSNLKLESFLKATKFEMLK